MTERKLNADPRRQATDAIRGYVYQIYQSLYAWITLKPGEVLALEGAEDFDVFEGNAVQVTQVKDTKKSGPVTLRTRGIVDAINDFWDLRNINADLSIQFRFLTTSPRGKERRNPLGQDVKGLDYWDSAKRAVVSLEPLVSLLRDLDLSESLKTFIQSADNEEILETLIRPIHWDTGRKPTEALIQMVDDRLIAHGLIIRVPAHDSLKARGTLLERLVTVITQPDDRILRVGDFAQLFEEATGQWQSRARIDALTSGALSRSGLAAAAALSPLTDLTLAPPVLERPPPLVQGAHPRDAVVEDLAAQLDEHRALFLYGSTGLGKTTLARLLVDKVQHEWLWGSFRGTPPEQLSQLLSRATNRINLLGLEPWLVIDDIDFTRLADFEPTLIGLVFNALRADGRVVITSQSRTPPSLFAKLWLSSECEREVPYFTEDEICALAMAHGCVSDRNRKAWSKLIWLTTQGHPQLVHARVRHLQSQNWPQPSKEDLFGPSDVEEVKRYAKRRLMSELPGEAARTLAYRLSIITSPFSRRMAMALAKVSPSIPLPGEAFETLIGPWIEQQATDLFRVSPLIVGSGATTLDPRDLPGLHEAVALTYATGSVTPSEVSTALVHGLAARSERALASIAYGIMIAPYEAWRVLADHLFWFVHWARKADQLIFEENLALNAMLRGVQFRVAANLPSKTDAISIAELWLAEIEQLEPPVVRDGMRLLAYVKILMSFEVPFRPRFIIRLLPEFRRLHEAQTDIALEPIGIKERIPAIEDETGRLDPSKAFVEFEVARINSIDAFEELLDSLAELGESERAKVLEPLASDADLIDRLVGGAWVSEVKKENPDLDRCFTALKRAITVGQTWDLRPLAVAAYVAISVLHDEYQDDTASAFSALDEAEAQLGRNFPRLLNQRAKILLHLKEYSDALAIWEGLFARAEPWPTIERVFAARSAGIASAHLGDWPKAEEFFLIGARLCREGDRLDAMRVGLEADAAFALWKSDQREPSLLAFSRVLDELKTLSDLNDLRIRALHAVVAHTIAWMYFAALGVTGPDHVEPPPGTMSSQERSEEFRKLEVRSLPFVWGLLGSVEGYLGFNLGIGERAHKKMKGKVPLVLQIGIHLNQITNDFRDASFASLVSHYVPVARCTLTVKRLKEIGGDSLFTTELDQLNDAYWQVEGNRNSLLSLFLAAVMTLVARKRDNVLPFKGWEDDLAANGIDHPGFSRFFELGQGRRKASQENTVLEIDLIAILKIRQGSLSPGELFKHCFYLLSALTHFEWGRFVERDWENIVTSHWRSVVENQRFALRLPNVTGPQIAAACDDQSSGYRKAAKILLSAAEAAGARLSAEARAILEQVAAEQPSGSSWA